MTEERKAELKDIWEGYLECLLNDNYELRENLSDNLSGELDLTDNESDYIYGLTIKKVSVKE